MSTTGHLLFGKVSLLMRVELINYGLRATAYSDFQAFSIIVCLAYHLYPVCITYFQIKLFTNVSLY